MAGKKLVEDRNKLSREQLRDFYRDKYVQSLKKNSLKRLSRLMPLVDFQEEDIVADFGCGVGKLMCLISDKVNSYYGIDFSEEMIVAAKQRQKSLQITNASFYCESIEDFCKKHPQTFDKAFAMDLSEHIYDDDWLIIIRLIHTTLKRDGKFYLHTPNKEFVFEIMKNRGFLKKHKEHIAVRDARQNADLLKRGGAAYVKIIYLPHYLQWLAWLHHFSKLPLIGKYFNARLFIEARPN